MALKVKNTFLEVGKESIDSAPVPKRSSSLPPTFKPCCHTSDDVTHSDDSTIASEKGTHASSLSILSETDSYMDVIDGKEGLLDFELSDLFLDDARGRAKITLSLVETVSKRQQLSLNQCVRSKLCSQAKPFHSLQELPNEVDTVIACVADALRKESDVIDVILQKGQMGGKTMIVARSRSVSPNAAFILHSAKNAFLNAAAASENTYVMGYNAQPFNTLDVLSFSAKLGHVPTSHRSSACWDTYEKGFCPRCKTCRWDHPTENDLMSVIVILRGSACANLDGRV